MADTNSVFDSYEFNAPQFVDFQHIDKGLDDENVDDYFNFDHEAGGQPVALAESFSELIDNHEDASPNLKTSSSRPNTPKRSETPRRKTPKRACKSTPTHPSKPGIGKENDTPMSDSCTVAAKKLEVLKKATEAGMPIIKPVLNNLCTDLSSWRKKSGKALGAANQNKPQTKSLRKSGGSEKTHSSVDEPKCKKVKRSHSTVTLTSQNAQPRSARARTRSVDPQNKSEAKRVPAHGETTKVRTQSNDNNNRDKSLDSKGTPKNTKAHKRTASAGSNTKSRASSMDSHGSQTRGGSGTRNRNVSLNSSQGVKMVKPMLTIPSTPSFMKRKPVSSAPGHVKTTEEMELEQIKEKRKELALKRKLAQESYKAVQTSTSYVPKHSLMKPTKPVEVKFATDERIKDHPMTTRQDSPKDFFSTLRHQSPEHENKPLLPTKPQPFHFMDKKRKREDEEAPKGFEFRSVAEKMIAFARKTPDRFRTRSKNQKVEFVSAPPPKLTVPKTPNLECKKRYRPVNAKSHAELEEEEAEEIKKYKFHAQPLNEAMFKRPTGIKEVEKKELTKPMEFDLETDRRVLHRHEHDKSVEPEEDTEHFHHAKPVPHHGIPFMPKYDHKVTEPKPFSFDEKDRIRYTEKEMKIKQIVEEERRKASEFKARPLKDLSPHLPPKKVPPPTQPEPFPLEIDVRGSQKAEEWRHKIEEELREQRAAANFKARPNHVVHKKPFLPQKSTKPLTDIDDVELATDRRAEERAEYDQYRHEREMEMEEQRRALERMKEEEERRKAEQQRAEAVHKAQPIKKYKRVEIKPSDRPLTTAKTPRFSQRLKSRID